MVRPWLSFVIALGCAGDGGGDGGVTGSDGGSSSGGTASGTATSMTTSTDGDGSSGGGTQASATSAADSSDGSGSSDGSTGASPGTAGCGIAASDPTMTWSGHTVDVDGVTREYWVWLPEPYDPARAYPVVYQFHGCSDGDDRWNNNPPVQDHSGADAIHVRGKAVASCWDSNPQGPDVIFFDALVADVEASWCADPEHRFATGYSSGSFMTHALGCARADVLRGIASIAGGQPGNDCSGQVAALLIHDADDQTVNISASESARDSLLARNGCDAAAPTSPIDPSPCEAYAGCGEGYPVVWCPTAGQDHSRQDGLAAPAFWGFLSSLP